MKKQIVGFMGALTLTGVGAFVAATEPEGNTTAPVAKPATSKSADQPAAGDAGDKSHATEAAAKPVDRLPGELPGLPAAEEVSHWGPARQASPQKLTAPVPSKVAETLPPVKIVAPLEKATAPAPRVSEPVVVTTAPPEVKKPAADPNDPHAMMQHARDLYVANRLDEAESLAQKVAAYPMRWGILEDSPKRLIDDIKKARLRGKQEDANTVLVEARKLFNRGMLEEAERLAYMAERMHGPYRVFDTGDRPQRLLTEIVEARAQASKPRVQPVPVPGPVAPPRDAVVRVAPAPTTWQEAPKARVAETPVAHAPQARAWDISKAGEAAKSANSAKAGSVKTETALMATAKVAEAKPESNKPTDGAKRAEVKGVETPNVVADAEPLEPVKTASDAKPADAPKPVVETKNTQKESSTDTPRLVPEPSMVGAPKLFPEPKLVETPNVIVEPKVIETPKEPKLAETPRAVVEPKVVDWPKAEPRPINAPKLSADAKPIETPKPVEMPTVSETPRISETPKVSSGNNGSSLIVPVSASVVVAKPVAEVVPAFPFVGPPYLPKNSGSVEGELVAKQADGLPDKLPAPVVGQAVTVAAPEKAAAAPEKAAVPAPPAKPVTPPAPATLIAAPACCDKDNCNSHEGSICLFGDVGISIMRPYFKNNPAFLVGGGLAGVRQIDFGMGTQFVPEISLGVVGPNDMGARITWWGFATGDHETVTGSPAMLTAAPLGLQITAAGAGDVLAADAHLSMNVWTFEATQDFQMGPWTILVAGGLRYAHIAQRYDAVDTTIPAVVRSGHNFDGIGPTLYARGRRQCGCSGAYVFSDARGSLLVGLAKQDAFVGLSRPISLEFATSSRTVMPVGELELGVGWRREMDGIDVFIETGVTGQTWLEAGSSSRSTITPNLSGPPVPPTTFNNTVDYNLGLMGITIRAGINY